MTDRQEKAREATGLCLSPSARNGDRGGIELSAHHVEQNDMATVTDTIMR
jgi:hypothetical protein